MRSLPLRQLVSGIGVFVSLTTALSIPVGYAAISYLSKADRLEFEARLNASRVGRYIYQHGAMWPFHRVRLAEVIELSNDRQDHVRQRIFTAEGKLVLEEGEALASPTLARSAPIVVSGATVGRMEVEMSARPLLVETALVGLVSALLGLVAYFGIRVFPLRVLDRTVGQLARREKELTDTNGRFEAALGNMPHGLCMFDARKRLVLCNKRYAALYGLPPELTSPGTALDDILAFRSARGNAPVDIPAYVGQEVDFALKHNASEFECDLQDGRRVRISYRPMRGGGYVASHEDITAASRAEARIAHMALHDALTSLPNRVLFREEMERSLARVRRGGKLAVLCLDLDHFKAVNDTLGHPVGDALLREVAERLLRCAGAADMVARLGGDEFAIVQLEADQPHGATALAQRVIAALGAPYDLDGHQVVIGASVGISVAPNDSEDPDQLLKSADMALYRAKTDGRGTYRFFEPEMDARMQARRALELDLRKALSNGEFEVHYQPLVNLAANKVSGFEALLRWTHPERGAVAPADFIPLAEEIGVIIPIGAWVLKQACKDAARWPGDVRLAVNLSPAQFKSRALVLDVIAALGASGLPARRLELEITETVMLHDTEITLSTLHQLRNLGVHISMDDFGTGYSSLSYLRKFPFDKIKIDQSFIRDLPGQAESVAIVRAITGLGASLGMSITAEGVETQAQLDELRAEGCTEVQGWLFSPARPAAEIAGLFASVAEKCAAAA